VSKDFDEILASGDEAAIEAALAEMETSGDILFSEEDDEPAPVEPPVEAPAVVEPVAENDVATPESSPTEPTVKQPGVREIDGKLYAEISADNAVIQSKNGKHHVPYDVLANARQEGMATKAQLDELTQANSKLQASLDETNRVSELYSKQLGDAGLDPELLPEQMLKDPALMAQIKEDYPQIGEVVSALASQLEQRSAQAAASQAEAPQAEAPKAQAPVAADPLRAAFEQTAHLKAWQADDIDRWDFAQKVDSRLAEDPLFESKPLAERLAEVERRTMAAFGDELPALAEKESPTISPKAPIPNTPTDVGHQGSDTNPHAHILDQDAGSMTTQMESMTEAQIEALLSDVSNIL